ncbi:hypothetical protein T02_11491 [Trichinella nativa]|uniref:Secreted protein n=1 Tax=Trichinella nativa TaxID=6335 RepID=A0A0V1KK88_9BILA|nr:hypothetical protein T02_11491 [Trichinella nativa]
MDFFYVIVVLSILPMKLVLLNLYEGQSLNACSCSAEFCKLRQELYRKPFLIVIIEPFPTFFWCHEPGAAEDIDDSLIRLGTAA